jgi:anti-sigma regulatory factor (Ser/Thr protein kinase)
MLQEVLDESPMTIPATGTVLLECGFDRSTLAAMRSALGRCGADSGLTDVDLAHFVLAVNEIATNAVRYGGGQGRLSLSRHRGRLWCLITDRGPGIPRRHLEPATRRGPDQIGGQGIWLARRICETVDIETARASGTRVMLRFST